MGPLFRSLLLFQLLLLLSSWKAFTYEHKIKTTADIKTPTTLVTNPSPCGLALAIADNNCPTPTTYTINITGETGTNLGTDVLLTEVRIIVDHNWEQDIEMSLTAPNGVQILLSSDNGGSNVSPGYGDFSSGTCGIYTSFVHPSHCTALPITDPFVTSFIGDFFPEGNFTDFDGNDPNGSWLLEICDDANIHTGSLEYVELVFEPYYCPAPTNVTVNNIAANTADVSWTAATSGASTTIEYVLAGAAQGTGTMVTATSSPFTLTGLVDDTAYEIYLAEDCGGGNASPLTCPIYFETDCTAPAATIVSNFDNQTACSFACGDPCPITGTWWNTTVADDFDWTVQIGTTSSPNTGPSDDVTGGGKYIYIETSDLDCRNGKFAVLQSNCIDLSAASGLCHFSFNYHLYGSSIGSLELEMRPSTSLAWTPLWSLAGNQGNRWYRQYVDLSAYDGQTMQFRFIATGGNNTTGDIALDDLIFYGSMDAGAPNNLYYSDADNDGYGDPNSVLATCSATAPVGFLPQGGDCDDADASINPTANEIPCNQTDDNCNGMADDSILPQPTVATISASVCGGASLTLNASSTPIGQYEWYDAPSGGNLLGTGNSISTMVTNNMNVYVVDTATAGVGLRITEAKLSFSSGGLEIQNIGRAKDYTGWKVVISDGSPGGNINNYNPVFWNLGMMTTNEIQTRDQSNWGQSFSWSSFFEGWIMIVDDNGRIADAMFWNWTNTEINNFNTTINGVTYTIADVPWTGGAISVGSCFGTLSLTGTTENNAASDFACENATIGTANVNLDLSVACGSGRVQVPVSISPQASLIATPILDGCGTGMGDIMLEVIGGQSPYTYLWSDGSTMKDLINVPYNTYTVTVTDAVGCTSELANGVNLSGPLSVYEISVVSVQHLDCADNLIGEIVMTVTGGVPPYQFNWSAGFERDLAGNIDSLNGLDGGAYDLTVTDFNGCVVVSHLVIVNEPDPINMNINSIVNNNCFEQTAGEIDINVLGGTPPYTYLWNNGMVSEDLDNLEEGDYRVTVNDMQGCSLVSPMYKIETPTAALEVNIMDTGNVTCANDANGFIDLEVTGGTAPYYYDWNISNSTQKDLQGLAGGNYLVTVTDANGCQDVSPFITITEAVSPITIIDNIVDVTCAGANNGTINLSVSGGVQPYEYQWSNLVTNTPNLSNLEAGNYYCTIIDANGCVFPGAAYVVNETPYTLDLVIDQVDDLDCSGTMQGGISVTTTGGATPYTYLWNTGETSEDINGLPGGLYDVTVVDNIGCELSINNIYVTEPEGLVIATSSKNATGNNDNGEATVYISGGTPPYSYSWSDSLSQTTATASNLIGGSYFVTVTDANGCRIFSNVLVDMLTTSDEVIIDAIDYLNIFPNPAQDFTYLELELKEAATLEVDVFNLMGQQIISIQRVKNKAHRLPLDFQNNSSGVYLIRLRIGDDTLVTKRLVVGK